MYIYIYVYICIYIYIHIEYIYIYIWYATRSPKIRAFKHFFDYFMLLFPLVIVYERSKFLEDALFLVC